MANNGPITNYKPEPVKSVCNKCGVNFNTADSLEVHVKYHHDNLMKKWAIEAAQTNRQRDETNNNNANKDNNIKREYITSSNVAVTAAADSTDAAMKPNSKSPDSYNSSVTPEMAPTTAGHPPTPQSYHSASSPYQTAATEPTSFSPSFHSFHSVKAETLSPNYANFPTNPTSYSDNQYFNMEPPQGQIPYGHDYQMNKSSHNNYRYHPYSNPASFERSPQVSSSAGLHSPSSYAAIQNPQPTPSPSPKQCDKCGFVCETAGQLMEHLQIAHPSTSYTQQPQQQVPQQPFQYPADSVDSKIKQEDEPQAEILDLDSQKVHVYQSPEEQEDALKRQAELAAMNGGHIPHSVSAMISWHNPQQSKMLPSLPDHRMYNTNGGDSKVYGSITDDKSLYHNAHEQKQLFQPHQIHSSSDYMSPDPSSNTGMVPNMNQQPPPVPHPYRPYEHLSSSQPNPPVITSSQVPNPIPSANIPPPVGKGANWKSNEARRPKTYNCSACNKWFTSSGHLKRHYNTTLHKNAVKTSGQPDPATLPISVHHHPSRDPNHQSNRQHHQQQQQQQQQQHQHHHQDTAAHSPNPLQIPPSNESNNDENNTALAPAYERSQHPGLLQQPPSGPYDRHPPNIGGSIPQSQHHSNNSLTNLSAGSPPNGEAGPSATNHHHHQHLDHSRGLQSISTSTNIPPHQLTPLTPIVSNMPAVSNPPLPPFNLLNQQPHMMGMHSPTPTSHHHIFHPMAPPHQITSNYPNGLSPHVTQTIMVTSSQPQGLINLTTGELVQDFQCLQANNDGPLPSFAQFTHFLSGVTPESNVGGTDSVTNPNLFYHSQPNQQTHNHSSEPYPVALFYSPLSNETQDSRVIQRIDETDNESVNDFNHLVDEHPSQSNTPVTPPLNSQNQSSLSPNTHISYRTSNPQATVLQPVDPNIQVKMEEYSPTNQLKMDNYSPTNQNNNHFPNDQFTSNPPELNEPILLMESPKTMLVKEKIQNENELMVTSSPTISSTNNSDAKHKCVDCDKTFNKACYLTQHNKTTHSGEKPFKCNRCGKRFIDNTSLQSHLKKHAGDKPHKCEQCPKQFNHKTDLRRHMCLHSGHKPFSCETCGKGFIRKDHMIKHCDTHLRRTKNNSTAKNRGSIGDRSISTASTNAESARAIDPIAINASLSDHSNNYS